jgi:hypothetical protein
MRKAVSTRRWCCWGRENRSRTAPAPAGAAATGCRSRLFKGFQKNPLPWIKGARMLVLSSDSEGFGNVVVEALLLDTPVASTRCPGGVTEILTGELPAAWRI